MAARAAELPSTALANDKLRNLRPYPPGHRAGKNLRVAFRGHGATSVLIGFQREQRGYRRQEPQ